MAVAFFVSISSTHRFWGRKREYRSELLGVELYVRSSHKHGSTFMPIHNRTLTYPDLRLISNRRYRVLQCPNSFDPQKVFLVHSYLHTSAWINVAEEQNPEVCKTVMPYMINSHQDSAECHDSNEPRRMGASLRGSCPSTKIFKPISYLEIDGSSLISNREGSRVLLHNLKFDTYL